MDINIIAGSCSEVNNEYIFSLLKNRDKSKNHIIIAPDRSQFSIEKRLFEETGEKCFFDINVISLSRLSKKIVKNTKKNILSKQSGTALVKKILTDKKDELFVFSKATNYIGFASSLFETICFYKSCNVLPQDMYVDDSDTFANLKQKDIKLIYTEYENYLQNDYTDSFNQLKVFADSINGNTFPNTIFYFMEFEDFTRIMYEIIVKLSKFSDAIHIACAYGKENNNSNIFSNKVYYDLIDLFKFEGLGYKINKVNGFLDNNKNLLSKNLLAYSPQNITLDNVEIRQFNNIQDEVKFTIADIYSKLIINKDTLSDFSIVVPSLNDYMPNIMQEIKKYRLNVYFDRSEKLINYSFVRLIFNICDILSGDYRYSDFSAIIKSPILNFNNEAVCEYDDYLKRIGAISNMCINVEKIEDEDLKQFLLFIQNMIEQIKNVSIGSECLDVVLSIFEYIKTRMNQYVETFDDLSNRTFTQVLNKFDNINKDYLKVLGEADVSNFAEFIDIYKEYFNSTNISMPPISSNTLFVADFDSSYVSTYKYIYILGNNDGKLPILKLDNGLVTDEELARLPNANKLTPTIAMLNARKVFKLYELCFKHRNELKLSYLLGNAEGKLYPNNLVESLKNIGNLVVNNYSATLDVVNSNFNELDIQNIVFNNLTKEVTESNLVQYITNWNVYNENINFRELCSSLYSVISDDSKELYIDYNSKEENKILKNSNFFAKKQTSISQIESYNKCPYMHFVKYGLKLKDFKSSNIQAVDIGNIIHEVLSKLVPFIIKVNDIDKVQAKAKELLDYALSKEQYIETIENKSNSYIIKALYRELERIVVAISEEIENSNFKPSHYEYRFDNILSINGVNVKGFIDRIDTKEDGFIVLDYKTGDNQFKNYNDLVSGKKLQLLVYASAFAKSSGLNPKGVFYFPIMNGFNTDNLYTLNGVLLKTEDNIVDLDVGLVNNSYKSKSIHLQTTSKGAIKESQYYKNMCLSQEDFDYLLDYVIKRVEKSIQNIVQGDITPRPLNENGKCVCDYCDYLSICNYNHEHDQIVETIEDINKLKEKSI